MTESKIFFTHPRVSYMTGRTRVSSRATIAWRVDSDGVTRAGVALCSPLDNFARAVGRNLSTEMLLDNPIEIHVTGNILTEQICGLLSTDRSTHFMRIHRPTFTPYYSR